MSRDESNNNPHIVNYALYFNGNLVPAQSVSITATPEDIEMQVSLAPSEYLFQLGMNDRILATLFYYDDTSDNPGWKLFAEGEISGTSMRRDPAFKSVYFKIQSLLHGALEYPIRTIFENFQTLLDEASIKSAVFPPLFIMAGFGAGGNKKSQSTTNEGGQNPTSTNPTANIIKCPFDYVSSLFEYLLGSQFYNDLKNKTEESQQQKMSLSFGVNAFRNAFLNVYITKWMYSRNFIKKIVPSPEQRPGVYEQLIKISNLSLMSRKAGAVTDGPLIDVLRSVLSLFNCRIQPLTLPPIVKLKRSTGPDPTPEAPTTKSTIGYGNEEQPKTKEGPTVSSVASSYSGLSRLYYASSNYNKYIAEFVVTDNSIYKAIPRCNLLVSNYASLVDVGTTYDRITRMYTQVQVSGSNSNEISQLIKAAFPPTLMKQQFDQKMYSNLISEEEMFRGPKVGQVQTDATWMYYAAAAAKGARKTELTYLQDEKCTKIISNHASLPEDTIKNILYLFRYTWNLYEMYRSMVNTAVVELKYINPYILAGFPAVYVDTEISRYNFVGNVSSITWNFTANGCSTTVNLSNVQSMEEYLSSVALSKTFASNQFITPAPSYIPNLDKNIQTEEFARYNYGLLLYDGENDSIVDFRDFFTYNNGVDIIISGSEDNVLDNLKSYVVAKQDCPYINSFESYMSYISRNGVSLEDYVSLSTLREDIDGKGMPPVKILKMESANSTKNALEAFLSNIIFAADNWDDLLSAYLSDVKNNNPIRG